MDVLVICRQTLPNLFLNVQPSVRNAYTAVIAMTLHGLILDMKDNLVSGALGRFTPAI